MLRRTAVSCSTSTLLIFAGNHSSGRRLVMGTQRISERAILRSRCRCIPLSAGRYPQAPLVSVVRFVLPQVPRAGAMRDVEESGIPYSKCGFLDEHLAMQAEPYNFTNARPRQDVSPTNDERKSIPEPGVYTPRERIHSHHSSRGMASPPLRSLFRKSTENADTSGNSSESHNVSVEFGGIGLFSCCLL